MAKRPLLQLPVAPSLPQFLKADEVTPSVDAVMHLCDYSEQKEGLSSKPSMLRRSRPVKGHFSFVTPLPVEFPFGVPEKLIKQLEAAGQKDIDVETLLAQYEPRLDQPVRYEGTEATGDTLSAYTSPLREQALSKAELFGLSQRCIDDCLPDLDVGDAFEVIKNKGAAQSHNVARQQLVDVLSGNVVAAKTGEKPFAPWSLCYGGHQFGSWANQLGDGRAISVLTTPAPSLAPSGNQQPPQVELQLKGAGRTPYSRFADGLAVLRSSVREYLGSEAVAALDIPTSRALSLTHLPDIEVQREQMESAAVVCRIAPSWLRIGNFQIQHTREEWDMLLQLARFVAGQVLHVDGPAVGKSILHEVARRNAIMVAGWQAWGFMHGVINTDNVSLLGLTIDYGPYAFMDVFDFHHICNHSDDMGRYAYRRQPEMIEFAIRKLGDSLSEMIGAEAELGKLEPGWAEGASTDKRVSWAKEGQAATLEVVEFYKKTVQEEQSKLFAKRFGLLDVHPEDDRNIFQSFLQLLDDYQLDFNRTFRLLCQFKSTDDAHFERLLELMLPRESIPAFLQEQAKPTWTQWFKTFEERISASEKAGGVDVSSREQRMQAANPRFVLRQWVLEETIARLRNDKDTRYLGLVLEMCEKPFEPYGEVRADGQQQDLVDAERVRLCDVGSKEMLGFQCSCSS